MDEKISYTYHPYGFGTNCGHANDRPCALNPCRCSNEYRRTLISQASRTMNSSQVQFKRWVQSHRNKSATEKERCTCPLLWCREVFNNSEQMLEHVSSCDKLPDGEYWCHEHQAAERFASAGVSRVLRRLRKRMQTKVHETKRAFRKLGPGSLHKSARSSRPIPSDSAMTPGLNGLGTERHRVPELDGTAHGYELSADRRTRAGSRSLYKSTLSSQPILSDTAKTIGIMRKLEATQVHQCVVIGAGPGSLHKPTWSSSPIPSDIAKTNGFNEFGTQRHLTPELGDTEIHRIELSATRRTCGELYGDEPPAELMSDDPSEILPYESSNDLLLSGTNAPQSISPLSRMCSSACDDEGPYTICTPSNPNSSDQNNHNASRSISPLGSFESAQSGRASTRPFPYSSLVFGQPANEQQVEGSGSHINRSAVPARLSPVPECRPLNPEQTPVEPIPFVQAQEIFNSIVKGTAQRLTTTNDIITLPEVMMDLKSGAETHRHFSERLYAAFVKAVNDAFANSCLLPETLDSSKEQDLLGLNLLNYVTGRVMQCEENDENRAEEKKGQENDCGWRAQGPMQRLGWHLDTTSVDTTSVDTTSVDTTSVDTFPDRNSPATTLSPALSFQTDSGYGTTSPVGSTHLCTSPDTPTRPDNNIALMRRRYNGTRPPRYHAPPDSSHRVLMPAAPIEPLGTVQEDQVNPDYLQCEAIDCGAKFTGKYRRSNLRKHTRSVHAKDPVGRDCPVIGCKTRCGRQDNLRSHIRKYHRDRPDAELNLPTVTQKRKRTAE